MSDKVKRATAGEEKANKQLLQGILKIMISKKKKLF